MSFLDVEFYFLQVANMRVQLHIVSFQAVILLLEFADGVPVLSIIEVELFELLVASIELSGDILKLLSELNIIFFHFGILLVLGDVPEIYKVLHLLFFTPNY